MIKIAILGTGFIATVFMEAIKSVPEMEVIAILAINSEAGKQFAKNYQGIKVYTDYDSLLLDQSVECIYIGLPNHLHYSYALKALHYKKNVIVEKPFVNTIEEINSLQQAAHENECMVFDAIPTRYHPNIEVLANNMKRLGNIKVVNTSYCQYSRKYNEVREGGIPAAFDLKKDGGALKDLGIYHVTFMVTLFGPPEKVTYFPNRLKNGCDSSGVLHFDYGTFIAICIQAKDCFTSNYCMIQGEDGTLLVDDDCFRLSNVRFKESKDKEELLSKAANDNPLVFEMKRIAEVYKARDFALCDTWLKQTKEIIKIIDKAALSAELFYST